MSAQCLIFAHRSVSPDAPLGLGIATLATQRGRAQGLALGGTGRVAAGGTAWCQPLTMQGRGFALIRLAGMFPKELKEQSASPGGGRASWGLRWLSLVVSLRVQLTCWLSAALSSCCGALWGLCSTGCEVTPGAVLSWQPGQQGHLSDTHCARPGAGTEPVPGGRAGALSQLPRRGQELGLWCPSSPALTHF